MLYNLFIQNYCPSFKCFISLFFFAFSMISSIFPSCHSSIFSAIYVYQCFLFLYYIKLFFFYELLSSTIKFILSSTWFLIWVLNSIISVYSLNLYILISVLSAILLYVLITWNYVSLQNSSSWCWILFFHCSTEEYP